jgi:hypothetical protein
MLPLMPRLKAINILIQNPNLRITF